MEAPFFPVVGRFSWMSRTVGRCFLGVMIDFQSCVKELVKVVVSSKLLSNGRMVWGP